MPELAYSLHLGSDKNRKNISKQNGNNNLSRTTSLPNNAIQNVRKLSKVDKHNYRKYDDNQELIEIVRGTSSPLDDVKELYLSEFEEARLEYNSKQSRPSRMIDNYFNNVSNNEKKDLACEIISFGQKPNCNKLYIELVGNKNDDILETLFPHKKLVSFLKENNIEYSISKNAGNYLCNNIYYDGMKYIKDNSLDIKMIFIHIPSINTKYDIEKTAKIIFNFIETLTD